MRQVRELVMERWCARVVFDGGVVTEMVRETTSGERASLQALLGVPVEDPAALAAHRLARLRRIIDRTDVGGGA